MTTKVEPQTMTAKQLWAAFETHKDAGGYRLRMYWNDLTTGIREYVVCDSDDRGWHGSWPEHAIAAALGVELTPDPQTLGIEEVVAVLDAAYADAKARQQDATLRGADCETAEAVGVSVGVDIAIRLLRPLLEVPHE